MSGLVIITIISCNNKPDIYNKEKEQFNTYLKNEFSKEITTDSIEYVLCPSTACIGCMKGTIELASENNAKKNVIFIISNKALLKDGSDLHTNNNVWIDKESKVDKLAYHRGNIGIIKTYDGGIYGIKDITVEEMSSFLRTLRNK